MSVDPQQIAMEDAPPSDHHDESAASDEESEPEAAAELMVKTRARRSNAGNRMSILLAKSAEEEEWGEEWEEAPNEEEFQGGEVNEQEDYNMDSSSSEEDDDGADDDDAGEKELRKAERREKNKKRKATTNPFTARIAAAARKKAKLDVPSTQSPMLPPPRPKKKSERASWLPTEEEGPIRMSNRKQTIANKDATLAKLKEKDKRRDDTLAMMKAAETRKLKAKEKPLTQAERLAEAARNERINKKTLHRWEEAEEARAAERQAKIDALKNRQIQGPFYRFYSGPGIWVDDKLKFTGKDAPTLDHLEEKLNREVVVAETPTAQPEASAEQPVMPVHDPVLPHEHHTDETQASLNPLDHLQHSASQSQTPSAPTTLPPPQDISQMPWTAASQGGDVFMGSHGMSSIMFAPPTQDAFLFGIDQYAQNQHSQPTPNDLPPNPFTQASPFQHQFNSSQPQNQNQHPSLTEPILHQSNGGPAIGPQDLLAQFQKPAQPQPQSTPLAPAPPRKKVIRRALRNLLILSHFPRLDATLPQTTSSRARTAASALKEKDKAALIQLSAALFNWSQADATTFVTQTLAAPAKPPRKNAAAASKSGADGEIALKPGQKICPITNGIARYRDPETGIAYQDARAFGVLRGVVGGGFVWSGDLGCYVGGRAKPLESMGGKGFLGMPPAKNVPRRFWEMDRRGEQQQQQQQPPPTPQTTMTLAQGQGQMQGKSIESTPVAGAAAVVVATAQGQQSPGLVKTESGSGTVS